MKGLVIISGLMILVIILMSADIQMSNSESTKENFTFMVDVPKSAGLIEIEFTPGGITICNSSDEQAKQKICSDGEGGAIITWVDSRSGSNQDIYAQRINTTGDTYWMENGIVICNKGGNQDSVQICPDGLGGAILTWRDFRDGPNGDVYAQRINSTGEAQWTVNGTAISTANSYQYEPQLCSDGNGGAIITWIDYRSSNWDIYVEWINSTGDTQWIANGIAICTNTYPQYYPQVCSDGNGGAIITWEDWRGTLTDFPDKDIYVQRINSTGDTQWTANGTAICAKNYDQVSPLIISDGIGGAIISWADNRTGDLYDILAQKINSDGVKQWNTNGVSMSIIVANQLTPQLISDGAGGAIIAWYDYRRGIPHNPDVYAQKVNSTGIVDWDPLGVVVCTGSDELNYIKLCGDNAGGAIISWTETRVGTLTDIYSQLIDFNGETQWTLNGEIVCNETNSQYDPQIVSDGSGGAFLTWKDYRNSSVSNSDIYAQRITDDIPPSPPSPPTPEIPFGDYYLVFTFLGIISLIIVKKRMIDSRN